MRTLKHALLLLLLGSLLAPILATQLDAGRAPVPTAIWVLVVLSGLTNALPFLYHVTVSTHPKYHILARRRRALRIHIVAGVLEIGLGLWAMASHAAPLPVRLMVLVALLAHVPSSLYQTPIVFGAQIVMWPAYLFAIVLHAFCAARLLVEPTLFNVVQTFLALHIYVWVRFFYVAFRVLDLFQGARYTSAIITAGMVIIPAILGPTGPLVGFGFILAYILLYRGIFRPGADEYRAMIRELEMDSLLPRTTKPTIVPARTDRERARVVFTHIDLDGNGAIDAGELAQLLAEWGLPAEDVDASLRAVGVAGDDDARQIPFDVFLTKLEPIWQHGYELLRPDRETDYGRLVSRNVERAIDRARAPRRTGPRTFDTIRKRH